MYVLGIETTCDETGASIVKNGREILSNILSSQVKIHKKYGGVVPEIAARMHLEALPFVVESALEQANISMKDVDGIAVAAKVGLPPALVTGMSYAKGLSLSNNKPLVEVNHLESHVHANWLYDNIGLKKDIKYKEIEYPHVCLLVSGGHTEILLVNSPTNYKILGQTVDDAAGEAFDKVARMMGLEYPGGAEIDRISTEGEREYIHFPRPMITSGDLDFSFSGLKTAVLRELEKHTTLMNKNNSKLSKKVQAELFSNYYADIAASFQEAVIEVLVYKTINATSNLGIELITLAGGVAANTRLREVITREATSLGYTVKYPKLWLCVDNAAMSAGRGYYDL